MNTQTKRRWQIGAAAVLFLWVVATWMFHFPHSRARLYGALPYDAMLITEHAHLKQRVRAVSENTIVRNVLTALGYPAGTARDMERDPGVRWLLRMLGSRTVVTGYAPTRRGVADGSWTFACWGGGYTQLLEWGFLDSVFSDFRKERVHGRTVWTLPCDDPLAGLHLSVAVSEGIVVGALAPHPYAVMGPLDRVVRGQGPISPLAHQVLENPASDDERLSQPDRIWLNPDDREIVERIGSFIVGGAAFDPPDSLEATVRLRSCAYDLSSSLSPQVMDELEQLIGDVPDALVVSPVSNLTTIMEDSMIPRDWRGLRILAAEAFDPAGQAFACLTGGAYSSRFMGMKIPAVLVGVQLLSPDRATQTIHTLADRLNARYGWGMIPVPLGNSGITALELIKRKKNSFLQPSLQLLFGVRDRWLIASTSLPALKKALDQSGEEDATSWRASAGDRDYLSAFGWCDLDATGAHVDTVLSVYTLLSSFSSSGSDVARIYNADVKLAILAIRAMGTLTSWVRRTSSSGAVDDDGDDYGLRFSFRVTGENRSNLPP